MPNRALPCHPRGGAAAVHKQGANCDDAAMDLVHHPAFQSLALPLLTTVLCIGLLRAVAGARWAPLGAAIGLLVALAVWPGFDWPALSRVQKLPWTVLIGTGLALLGLALRPPPPHHHRLRGVAAAAGVTVAALGLVAWAGLGGSLLLAQLALMVATATAVLGLWVWWRPGSGMAVGAAALLPMVLAGLLVGATLVSAPTAPAPQEGSDPYYAPQWK